MLVLLFGFDIIDLPCHAVTLQSDVRVRYAVIKYKTYADIKEVIRSGIFIMFTFTTYYDPSSPLWGVVANCMSSLWVVS